MLIKGKIVSNSRILIEMSSWNLKSGIFHSLLVSFYSSLVTCYSLLFYSLLVAFLLVTRWILLVTCCVFTRYPLRFYSLPGAFLLVTRFLLPVAFGNGKSNLNAEFLPPGLSVAIHHNVEAGSNIARKNSSS